ncbi:MAG TPA: hypothetical protein P5080_05395 [Candidatus Paceibacterota bacterium]|nr:hypothetical protein [Candidatus Pacearchaeota archaeon]HRZ51382.1 hypothetical protein [Candidatus Paceibacterota bacterium]HSA37104.1 hypothetical protein [Candidatus Paceibacterota bacterium]
MKVWHKILLGFAIYTILFVAVFFGLYAGAMDQEPDKYLDRAATGRSMADSFGSSYSEITNITGAPQYGYSHEERQASFENFKEQTNRILGNNHSALVGTFVKDYQNQLIVEEYWYLKATPIGTIVGKIMEPTVAYPIPATEWGPQKYFRLPWTENIKDRSIVFSKPKTNALKPYFYFHAFFSYLLLTVGSIATMGIVAFFYIVAWIAWIGVQDKSKNKTKKA